MPAIKNAILYSLFLVSSMHISLHCQDDNEQDNEEVVLIFDASSDDSNSDEIYPLQDADIACLMPEIQTHVDTLEFDSPDIALPEEIFAIEDSIQSYEQLQDDEIFAISKDQLEELLDGQCKEIQECLFADEQANCDFTTISVDCLEVMLSLENGILLHEGQLPSAENVTIVETEEDEIVPVPHDLINSVKKANRQKNKLEKLERKEKAHANKKSKKKNK